MPQQLAGRGSHVRRLEKANLRIGLRVHAEGEIEREKDSRTSHNHQQHENGILVVVV